MGLLISLLSSSLQQCWDLGSQISLLSLHLYDGVVVVGFVVVSGFWLGSVVKDLGFVVGWLIPAFHCTLYCSFVLIKDEFISF